ncbi:MAG: hypothetical protein QME61_01410 [Patescibacteria group bacterium]|nr:hypothetical protein [Patescibacteria group bacterium]
MKKGITLIETIVTIFIFALTMGAVAGFIVMGYRTQTYTWEQSQAISEAGRGIERMVREIREAQNAESGAFTIESAKDYEFVFYSDVDKDSEIERVRYFLGGKPSFTEVEVCTTTVSGGSCSVNFPNFLKKGALHSAQVTVQVEGDFGGSWEYAEIYADGVHLSTTTPVCKIGCHDCPGNWEGITTFNVTELSKDGSIQFTADASSGVDPWCAPYSMRAKFTFSWIESVSGEENEFRRGLIDPIGWPPQYPQDQEEVSIISQYVRNQPPIFRYFDENGNELPVPARKKDTKLMKVYLVIDVNPNRPPQDFELESEVQIRNLKKEF